MKLRRSRLALTMGLLVSATFLVPQPVLADNCGSLFDCWDTLDTIAAIIAAIVVVAALVALGGEIIAAVAAEAAAEGAAEVAAEAAAQAMADAAAEAAAETAASPFPWIDALNMGGGASNCGDIALEVDSTLAEGGLPTYVSSLGEPTELSSLENATGSEFLKSSLDDIGNQLLNEGSGARGIVYVDGPSSAHVFNAVNVDGSIWYLDGQLGLASQSSSTLAQASGYAQSAIKGIRFMLTWPPI